MRLLSPISLLGFVLILVFNLIFVPRVSAEPDSDAVRDALLGSDVEAAIKLIEDDKAKSKDWELGIDNTRYYAMSLIILGNIADAEKFLRESIVRYPKDTELKNIYNHIYFFGREFAKAYPDKYAQEHIELMEMIRRDKSQTKKIIKAIESLPINCPYFLTKTDYLLELANDEALKLAENQALDIIKQNRKKLFFTTMDFYTLASAYKALAVAAVKANNIEDATRYIKLARDNVYKMRAIWLEEDIIVHRPILKIDKRSTKFGYVLPQWLILLREEYDNYLIN